MKAPVKKHGGSREGTGPKLQHQKDVADEAKFPRLWSWLGQSGSGGDGSATKRPRTDDTDLVVEILAGRAEKAGMLGFDHRAAVSLQSKMAGSVEDVTSLMEELRDEAHSRAVADFTRVKAYAAAHGHPEGEELMQVRRVFVVVCCCCCLRGANSSLS